MSNGTRTISVVHSYAGCYCEECCANRREYDRPAMTTVPMRALLTLPPDGLVVKENDHIDFADATWMFGAGGETANPKGLGVWWIITGRSKGEPVCCVYGWDDEVGWNLWSN